MSKRLALILLIATPAFAAGVAVDEVQETTVQAPKIRTSFASLLESRKQKSVVADVLSQEAMARSGDSDAAASLRRVTGLTLVNGKFVYVRGLGERYSSVLLNGAQVPSPEPSRRVVPLDLFPISVLESISVQKSFSPDKPAEFGGGLIELQTKPIPREFTAQMTVGLNADNTQPGLDHKGGAQDMWGFDDGSRQMPGRISSAFKAGRRLVANNPPGVTDGVSAEALTSMGRALQNNYNVSEESGNAVPNFNFSVGDSTRLGSARLGTSLGLLYSQTSDLGSRKADSYNVGGQGELLKDTSSDIDFAEREIQLGAALDTGLEWRKQTFKFTSLLLRNTTKRTEERTTVGTADSVEARRTTNLEWAERQLFLNQLAGKHELDGAEINWRLNHSTAGRESPDQREYTYLRQNGVYSLNTDTTGNRRVWSELEDTSKEAALEVNLKFKDQPGDKFHWKNGVVYNQKERVADVYRLHLKNNFAPGTTPDLTQQPEDIFRAGNIGPDGFQLTNLTESADSFTGEQDIVSLYSSVEWSPSKQLDVLAGYRQEQSTQRVRTFYYFDPNTPTSQGELAMKDVLPALNLTWKPGTQHRVRFGYGETLARPDFRELSSVPYIEEETGYEVVGNSKLEGTIIKNWDVRYEYYFGPTDYISSGLFYKKFQSPVEAVFEPGPNLRKTFTNAESAENRGAEVEGRLGLGRFGRGLRRWTIQSNVAVVQSQVALDAASSGILTTESRPLQGQSPYVANFQVLYDRPAPQVTAGLIYNVVGKRITEVGTSGRPDVYEQPFHQLDAVFNQRIGKKWGYGFRARNLLDPEALSTQGDKTVRSRKRGRSYALSATAYF
jgi:outer membrane receptor protein involved in Fe transport